MVSKYLHLFNEIETRYSDCHELIGDCIYVEELPEPEVKTASGIVLTTNTGRVKEGITDNKPRFVLVLAVGKGFYDPETGKDVPVGVQPGDVVIVPSLGVEWFNVFGDLVCDAGHRIGLTRESEIRHRFKGAENYGKILGVLRRATEHGKT